MKWTVFLVSALVFLLLSAQVFGEYKTGKSCFYIKRIEDIDTDVARDLIQRSVEHLTK